MIDLKTKFAELKIRLDRGSAILNWFRNVVILVAGFKIILSSQTILQSIILAIGLVLLMYLLGTLDLDSLKIMQKEQELLTSKYNPHLNKVGRSK